MARQVTAGILLDLNDQLSPKIQGAGIAVEDFADKTAGEARKVDKTFTPKIQGAGASAQGLGEKAKGAAEKVRESFSSKLSGAGIALQGFAGKAVGAAEQVNKAFSGVAGTLGALGISIGALSTINSTINLDNRMARLGLTANASAAQVNALKRHIFETAQMPDIKLDTDSIISGLEVVMTKVGDLGFVQDNVRNIALAIQASGESGDSMGAVFAEFAKFGYTMEEILPLMNDLIAQGDQGAFTFGEFAKNAPAVFLRLQRYRHDAGTYPQGQRRHADFNGRNQERRNCGYRHEFRDGRVERS